VRSPWQSLRDPLFLDTSSSQDGAMPISPHTFPNTALTPYDPALRARLQTGDLLLCNGQGVFSELIQRATDSLWSHVALIARFDDIDRLLLFESVETFGVRTVALSRYLTDHDQQGHPYPGGLVVVRHRTLARESSPERIQRMLQFAVDQFGSAYNRHDIVRIAARVLGNTLQPATAQPKWAPSREFICSEYVAACFQQAGVVLPPGPCGYVTPGDFANPEHVDLIAVLQPPE
jgi:hypothetical protein